MITVSVKKLVSAIEEADGFKLPDMNEGTGYLYNDIYRRLTRGEDVRLSEIDFDAFEADDVDSLNDLHSDIFERNYYTADNISSALRTIVPVCKAVGYV